MTSDVLNGSLHLPECPILKPCCDDEEFPEHGFCGNFVGRCLHCMAECICDALRACEVRVLNDYRKQHDGISEGYFQQIRNDALNAARDAVTAIESDRDALVWWERFGDNPDDPDEVTVLIELHRAIAAINALRDPVP